MSSSGAGYFMAGQNGDQSQLTPQQKMAMALMGGDKAYNPQQANSGIANAGSSLAGAMAMQNMQQQAAGNSQQGQIIQQRYGMSPTQAAQVMNPNSGGFGGLGGLFNMGGGGS